jgi:hypothetical protein
MNTLGSEEGDEISVHEIAHFGVPNRTGEKVRKFS